MTALINEITQCIAAQLRPAKIIAFGSQAAGEAKAESDLDLLIIYDGPLSKRDVKLAIRGLFPHPQLALDLFVLTSDEFARQARIPTTIGRTAAQEGVICHG